MRTVCQQRPKRAEQATSWVRYTNAGWARTAAGGGGTMSYDILKNLGLDRVDTTSPDFLKTLERMQREAWQSLQKDESSVTEPIRSGVIPTE